MKKISGRLEREKKTIGKMVGIYCAQNHKQSSLVCGECRGLLDYSISRLEKCRFGSKKPVCLRCVVHCYKKDMRDLIRRVMRYSGPRMLLKHPYLAVMHLIDSFFN